MGNHISSSYSGFHTTDLGLTAGVPASMSKPCARWSYIDTGTCKREWVGGWVGGWVFTCMRGFRCSKPPESANSGRKSSTIKPLSRFPSKCHTQPIDPISQALNPKPYIPEALNTEPKIRIRNPKARSRNPRPCPTSFFNQKTPPTPPPPPQKKKKQKLNPKPEIP